MHYIVAVQSPEDGHLSMQTFKEHEQAKVYMGVMKKLNYKTYFGISDEDYVKWNATTKSKYPDMLWKYFTK